MAGLHTWAGVSLGALLFAIFWTGTLSVFDREIDRWMMPATRLAMPDALVSLDALSPLREAARASASSLSIWLPTERDPIIRASWRGASGTVLQMLDPGTGDGLPDPGTWAGTRFLYPFHYMLHVRLWQLGYWTVGLAAMAMLVLCVSGVIIHRRIFSDLFVLRLGSKPRRLLLDLHNVAGAIGLPFHFVITLSGLITFYLAYFPMVLQVGYQGDRQAFAREAQGAFARPRLAIRSDVVQLDLVVAEARRLWEGDWPRFVTVRYPGDAAAYVQVGRLDEGRVGGTPDIAYFDASTGRLLHQYGGGGAVLATQRTIAGLHLIQFRHWTVRWLYFGLGLLGCVLIATGSLFWMESRRRRHEQLGLGGVRLVAVLTVGSVTGILVATLSFFVANRLLPPDATFVGQDRASLEICAFYFAWLAAFAHAWLRPASAWADQCWAIAMLAAAAVLLNWVTTGDHPVRSVAHRHLWPIAGMDVVLATASAAAFMAWWKIDSRRLALDRA